MAVLDHAGYTFRYIDVGRGIPVIFQHGLGGSLDGIVDAIGSPDGYRLISMDFRGHGETAPAPTEDDLDLRVFAGDIVRLLDHIDVDRAVVGGISMGAAVALRVALDAPARVTALALSRPALGCQPVAHLQAYEEVARLLRRYGREEGARRFAMTAIFAELAAESRIAGESLLAQFSEPRALDSLARLDRIPYQHPYQELAELSAIGVPTVVMGQRLDPLHPYQLALDIAAAIPGAQFCDLTPKLIDANRHDLDTRRALADLGSRVKAGSGQRR